MEPCPHKVTEPQAVCKSRPISCELPCEKKGKCNEVIDPKDYINHIRDSHNSRTLKLDLEGRYEGINILQFMRCRPFSWMNYYDLPPHLVFGIGEKVYMLVTGVYNYISPCWALYDLNLECENDILEEWVTIILQHPKTKVELEFTAKVNPIRMSNKEVYLGNNALTISKDMFPSIATYDSERDVVYWHLMICFDKEMVDHVKGYPLPNLKASESIHVTLSSAEKEEAVHDKEGDKPMEQPLALTYATVSNVDKEEAIQGNESEKQKVQQSTLTYAAVLRAGKKKVVQVYGNFKSKVQPSAPTNATVPSNDKKKKKAVRGNSNNKPKAQPPVSISTYATEIRKGKKKKSILANWSKKSKSKVQPSVSPNASMPSTAKKEAGQGDGSDTRKVQPSGSTYCGRSSAHKNEVGQGDESDKPKMEPSPSTSTTPFMSNADKRRAFWRRAKAKDKSKKQSSTSADAAVVKKTKK